MQLKKILAVALAATTTLSMLPANVANAAMTEKQGNAAASGDTFTQEISGAASFKLSNGTTTSGSATFTYEITDVQGSSDSADNTAAKEGTNEVKVVKVAKNSNSPDGTLVGFTLPSSVTLNDNTGRYYDRSEANITSFDVTGVDLTADDD